jgi:hypothetical protein
MLSKRLVWTREGNIFTRHSPCSQVFFVGHRELELLVDCAEEKVGGVLRSRLRESRRHYTRNRVLSQMEGVRGAVAQSRVFSKQTLRAVVEEASLYGMGNLEVNESRPGASLKARIAHPYQIDLLVGDLLGLWEGLNGVKAQYALEKVGPQDYRFEVEGMDKVKHKFSSWRAYVEAKPGKKNKAIQSCKKCKLPAALGALQWDEGKGIIYDPEENRYLVLMEVAGFHAVLQELKGHLGGDFREVVARALYESIQTSSSRDKHQDYALVLEGFPLYGWGRQDGVARRPFVDEIRILCPASSELVEGRLSAVYRLREKEPPEITSTKEGEGAIAVRLGPELLEYSMHIGNMRQHYPFLANYPLSFFPF